ncbi:hypothetical protein ACGH6R_06520 [Gilliamella sp. CG13]|uniref:CdiA C-terminal domain-containing protein n=2 Tax=unclassified Gilliamella TaxID=2685620 RepID=UPI0039864F02
MKCYKLITQKEWLALQKKAPESLLAQYGFYEFPKTQLQASGYNTVRYDYSAAQDEAIAHCVQHPEQCQQLYPTLENLGLYYGNNHYGHDNAKVTQALTEALTTGRALLIEKPLTLDCGLLPPQTNFLRLPSNKAPRKLTPAEIRERELFFFDDDNWIEFSVENLPNQSFTLFNSSNQRMIYQGQLDSRGHAYVNLEPDIKLVDVIFDRQTQHRVWYQDVPLQILGGLRDAGQSTLDLLWDSTLINPVSPLFFARVHAEIISDKPIGQAPNPIQMPEVSPPQTISGGITHGVSQFIVGFIPAVRATKFIKPLKNVGSWVKGMIAGSVTDFTVFSPHEERLSNLVQEFPELANPITEYLQAKPDDSFAEGRLKNSLEGIIAGGLAEPLTRSLRLLKYARIKITGTEVRAKVHHKIEAVEVELDEVNWNNVVEKGERGSLTGKPTEIPLSSTSENIRSIIRENESAQILSKNGYHVEQNPITSGIKKPDYKINGEIFDNYAPSSNNVRNIWAGVEDKVLKGQTNNVVINISDSKVTIDALEEQFSKWEIKGLDKIIVIDKSGNITRIK